MHTAGENNERRANFTMFKKSTKTLIIPIAHQGVDFSQHVYQLAQAQPKPQLPFRVINGGQNNVIQAAGRFAQENKALASEISEIAYNPSLKSLKISLKKGSIITIIVMAAAEITAQTIAHRVAFEVNLQNTLANFPGSPLSIPSIREFIYQSSNNPLKLDFNNNSIKALYQHLSENDKSLKALGAAFATNQQAFERLKANINRIKALNGSGINPNPPKTTPPNWATIGENVNQQLNAIRSQIAGLSQPIVIHAEGSTIQTKDAANLDANIAQQLMAIPSDKASVTVTSKPTVINNLRHYNYSGHIMPRYGNGQVGAAYPFSIQVPVSQLSQVNTTITNKLRQGWSFSNEEMADPVGVLKTIMGLKPQQTLGTPPDKLPPPINTPGAQRPSASAGGVDNSGNREQMQALKDELEATIVKLTADVEKSVTNQTRNLALHTQTLQQFRELEAQYMKDKGKQLRIIETLTSEGPTTNIPVITPEELRELYSGVYMLEQTISSILTSRIEPQKQIADLERQVKLKAEARSQMLETMVKAKDNRELILQQLSTYNQLDDEIKGLSSLISQIKYEHFRPTNQLLYDTEELLKATKRLIRKNRDLSGSLTILGERNNWLAEMETRYTALAYKLTQMAEQAEELYRQEARNESIDRQMLQFAKDRLKAVKAWLAG
jgi:hypothetical protein